MIIRMIIQRGIYYEKGVSNFCGCDGCYERCMHVRECGYGRAMQLSSAERLADRIVAEHDLLTENLRTGEGGRGGERREEEER